MKKIVTVIGARPQFIKAAVVSRVIKLHDDINEVIVHTGQHYDANMSDIFFDELDIPRPHHNLAIGGGKHGQNTGRMIEAIEAVLETETPDYLLVYGDTNTTLAGSVAASKMHIPIAHVEAGLRSYNRRMPEEINRILTDHVSELLFTPSEVAVHNLSLEGITGDKVKNVGDVMFDAVKFYSQKAENVSRILEIEKLQPKGYYLMTLHRQENTDDLTRLQSIFAGLESTDKPIIWPIHPRTRKHIASYKVNVPSNIRLIDPVGYLDMVMLEKQAFAIITDSGGVQKEAYYHGIPSVTLRDQTEWVELVNIGATKIVGADTALIRSAVAELGTRTLAEEMIYGRGDAGELIVAALK